jgi:hypothetical protein
MRLQAVCLRCPLGGSLLFQGLVTTPEGPLDLLVAECPDNTPHTRLLVNIKANKIISKGTGATKDSKGIKDNKDNKDIKDNKDNKDIMVVTRIGVEAEEAMVDIVVAGFEARTVITMAVSVVEVVEVMVATREDQVTTLSSSL